MTTVVDAWIPSPHHSSRGAAVPEVIVVHFTGGNGEPRAVGRLFQRMSRGASSHYTIGRDGWIAQHVAEARAAWHAGDGQMPAKLEDMIRAERERWSDTVNRRSIGIELCNRGFAPSRRGRARVTARHANPRIKSTTWEAYPEPQINALVSLMNEIRGRHPSISAWTGHEDVTNNATLGDDPNTPEVETRAGGKADPGPALPSGRIIAGTGLPLMRFDWEKMRFVLDCGHDCGVTPNGGAR